MARNLAKKWVIEWSLNLSPGPHVAIWNISDVLNNHFSNGGPLLASEIPPFSIDFGDYINPVSHAFTLT